MGSRTSTGAAVAVALAALVVAGAVVFTHPGPAVRPEALWRALRAFAVAAAWWGAALGAGRALALRLVPALAATPLLWLHSAALGLLLWGGGGLALAVAGQLHTVPVLVLGGLLATGWLVAPRPVLPRPSPTTAALAGLALAFGALQALAPAVGTDELYQHLALPQRMLRAGGLVGGVLHPDGSRPMLLHLPLAMLLDTGGSHALRLALALLGGGLVAATGVVAEEQRAGAGPLAMVVLVGSWSFLQELGIAANNLPTALFVLAATHAALRGWPVLLALHAGGALGVKYTAAGGLVGAGLAARMPWRHRFAAGAGAAVLVAPWLLRNALEGLHPLFPYAGWEALAEGTDVHTLRFFYLEKYGAGRGALDFLMLPWNAVMTADPGSFRFLGRVTPALLPLGLAGLVGALVDRRLRAPVIAAAVGCVAWASGPHWLRHLLPVLPVVAAAGAAAVHSLAQGRRLLPGAVGLSLLAGVPGNLFPAVERAADRLPVATGHEDPDTFGARHQVSWEAARWAREHLPEDARVAVFFDWSTALLERDTVMGSVEDHVPTRFWVLTRGERALAALQAEGVTHVLVGRAGFLRRQYPFIDERAFRDQLLGPLETFDDLLLMQATLIHEARGTRIYRLPESGSSNDSP